ncbi:unnamed protein product [Closterium sp. NIES-64]|nr:unnamed protein product [Closterium sp. NIES-64]
MSGMTHDDPENPPLHQSLFPAHVRARDAAEPSAGIAGPRGEELQVARPVEGPAAPGQGAECPEAGKVGGSGGGRWGRAELSAAENGAAPAVRGASGGRGTRGGRGAGGGRKRRKRIAVARTVLGCACALLALLGVALMARRGEDGGISGAWLAAEPLLVHPSLEPSPLLLRGLGSFTPETDVSDGRGKRGKGARADGWDGRGWGIRGDEERIRGDEERLKGEEGFTLLSRALPSATAGTGEIFTRD